MRFLISMVFVGMLGFSSTSFAEWTATSKNPKSGTIFYVDFERIRKRDGYVYHWILYDFAKPTSYGHLSATAYLQGDCKVFRFKHLSNYYYNEPMGGGEVDFRSNKPDKEWKYPPPNSVQEGLLKSVCRPCAAVGECILSN